MHTVHVDKTPKSFLYVSKTILLKSYANTYAKNKWILSTYDVREGDLLSIHL